MTNEVKTPIPARLYNAAVGGHVAGTEDIYDDTKGKTQKQINTEVEQSLGSGGSVDSRIQSAVNNEKSRAEGVESSQAERITTLENAVGSGGSVDERIATEGAKHYLKSETYTKDEVHGLITTPNQQYITVTATNQTTAVTDILPASGEADTVYRVGNWDGSAYDDTVYSEYAWNGTDYVFLRKKDYGIDDKPTAGSDNLVKSGGAYNQKFTYDFLTATSTQTGAAILNDGTIQSDQYTTDGAILSFGIVQNEMISIKLVTPYYNFNYCWGALYKDNKFIKYLGLCTSQNENKEYYFINENADTLKVCCKSTEISNVTVYKRDYNTLASQVVLDNNSGILTYDYYQRYTLDGNVIGNTYQKTANNWRSVCEISVEPNMRGCVDILNLMGGSDLNTIVCITDYSDNVIDTFLAIGDENHLDRVNINLANYDSVKKICIQCGPNSIDYPLPVVTYNPYNIINNVSINRNVNSKKGILLLHFDAALVPNDNRLSLLEEYGLNASWCLNRDMFGEGGGDNTFLSWRDNSYRDTYWSVIKRGDDVGLYPSIRADFKNESEWISWINTAISNLENLGIYNITTFDCAQLAINDNLYNAVKKTGFKMIRGGGDAASQDTYTYTEKNKFMSCEPSNDNFIVNKAISINDNTDLVYIKQDIEYAIQTNTALSLFTHEVISSGTVESWNISESKMREVLNYISSKINAGELIVMPWRKYYSMVNKTDGHEWDYSRILKMTIN